MSSEYDHAGGGPGGPTSDDDCRWYDRVAQDRDVVLRLLPRHSIGVEVGVWAGEFSQQLLDAADPTELHLIDPWRFHTDAAHAGAGYAGRRARSQVQMDELHRVVVSRFIDDDRVHVDRSNSLDAVARFAGRYFDWVYLDGDHSADSIVADLAAWSARVRTGGLLMGDDYGNEGWWGDSVNNAVDDFVAAGRCEVVTFESQQFILRMLG